MKKEALSSAGNPDLVLFAFCLFFLCFIGILIRTLFISQKDHYKKLSKLPFENHHFEGEHK